LDSRAKGLRLIRGRLAFILNPPGHHGRHAVTIRLQHRLLGLAGPLIFVVAGYAANAAAEIPACPTSKPAPRPAVNCTKKITIFNYSATDPLFPVIEVTFHAGGDDWLIALNPLGNNDYKYPTNNLYRSISIPIKGSRPAAASRSRSRGILR